MSFRLHFQGSAESRQAKAEAQAAWDEYVNEKIAAHPAVTAAERIVSGLDSWPIGSSGQ